VVQGKVGIWIEHADGAMTGYIHMKASAFLVTEGQTGEAHDQIGKVGSEYVNPRPLWRALASRSRRTLAAERPRESGEGNQGCVSGASSGLSA
jgi:hypothetical protein